MAWACCRLRGCWDQGWRWGRGGQGAGGSCATGTLSRAGCVATRIEMQQDDFSRRFMDCRAPHCSPPLLMLLLLSMLLAAAAAAAGADAAATPDAACSCC